MGNVSILFSRFQSHGSAEKFNDILIVEPDGSGEVHITSNPAPDGLLYDNAAGRFNSDRTKIAFLSTFNSPDNMYNVFIKSLVDGAVVQITQSGDDFGDVDWSPDNSQLLVSAVDDNGMMQLCLLDSGGTGMTQLTSGDSDCMGGRYSPAGDRIVFQKALFSGEQQIWMMDADGTNQAQLPTGVDMVYAPNWSPDGEWVVFVSSSGQTSSHIKKINVTSGKVVSLTNPLPGCLDIVPVWASSGIVFSSNRDLMGSGQVSNLYVMDGDGGNVRRITSNGQFDYPSDW